MDKGTIEKFLTKHELKNKQTKTITIYYKRLIKLTNAQRIEFKDVENFIRANSSLTKGKTCAKLGNQSIYLDHTQSKL